jgi:hypothetical protein
MTVRHRSLLVEPAACFGKQVWGWQSNPLQDLPAALREGEVAPGHYGWILHWAGFMYR